MRKVLLSIFSFVTATSFEGLKAQILTLSPGTDLTIKSGTVFFADNIILVPSADFTLSNLSLSNATTVIHTTANNYIARVYQFSANTNPFTGSVQINYQDGTELRGIAENALTLNIHNGTLWNAYTATTRDGTNNYVLTSGLSAVILNELTLANLLAPLPLVWLSFTATKQNSNSLLQWATAQEQNTKDFTVQHSTDGTSWNSLTTMPAAGNSNSIRNYSYVHTNPVKGNNYYRILQTDADNKYSYSEVRTVKFATVDMSFTVMGNPVTNGILTVQVNAATALNLYSADGKLILEKEVSTGMQSIDVSVYAKGIYLLKTNATIQKIVIQ